MIIFCAFWWFFIDGANFRVILFEQKTSKKVSKIVTCSNWRHHMPSQTKNFPPKTKTIYVPSHVKVGFLESRSISCQEVTFYFDPCAKFEIMVGYRWKSAGNSFATRRSFLKKSHEKILKIHFRKSILKKKIADFFLKLGGYRGNCLVVTGGVTMNELEA